MRIEKPKNPARWVDQAHKSFCEMYPDLIEYEKKLTSFLTKRVNCKRVPPEKFERHMISLDLLDTVLNPKKLRRYSKFEQGLFTLSLRILLKYDDTAYIKELCSLMGDSMIKTYKKILKGEDSLLWSGQWTSAVIQSTWWRLSTKLLNEGVGSKERHRRICGLLRRVKGKIYFITIIYGVKGRAKVTPYVHRNRKKIRRKNRADWAELQKEMRRSQAEFEEEFYQDVMAEHREECNREIAEEDLGDAAFIENEDRLDEELLATKINIEDVDDLTLAEIEKLAEFYYD